MQRQFLPVLVAPLFVRMVYKDVGRQLCALRKEWETPSALSANKASKKAQVIDSSIDAMVVLCSEGKVAREE